MHSERGMPNVMNYENLLRAFGEEHIEPVNTLAHPNAMYGLHDYTLGGVPNWAAIEFMAQAAAALAGCVERECNPAQPVRPGLLLGTRRLTLSTDSFAAGRTYRVTAENAFWDNKTAVFTCTIVDDAGAVVAEAAINAYRPPDFGAFLKEQEET